MDNPLENNDELVFVTTKEYAKLRGKSVSSIRRERIEGRGPRYVKTGSARQAPVFYRLSDIKQYLNENTIDPAARQQPESES